MFSSDAHLLRCGEHHEFLDPTFRRPEAYVRLDAATKVEHAKADDDLCWIAPPESAPRYFVRGVLPVTVTDRARDLMWGLWAEVSEAAFKRILDLWTDPNQDKEPPFSGELANVIPSYADTLGLPNPCASHGAAIAASICVRRQRQAPIYRSVRVGGECTSSLGVEQVDR